LIDESFLKDLPPNVDPCGENGEYHSFVFDGPIFKTPVAFEKGEVVYRKYDKGETDNFDTGFFYLDLLPKANTIER
jgi:diphthamide synthase (EF-2-diphthine--ammonia ligase)